MTEQVWLRLRLKPGRKSKASPPWTCSRNQELVNSTDASAEILSPLNLERGPDICTSMSTPPPYPFYSLTQAVFQPQLGETQKAMTRHYLWSRESQTHHPGTRHTAPPYSPLNLKSWVNLSVSDHTGAFISNSCPHSKLSAPSPHTIYSHVQSNKATISEHTFGFQGMQLFYFLAWQHKLHYTKICSWQNGHRFLPQEGPLSLAEMNWNVMSWVWFLLPTPTHTTPKVKIIRILRIPVKYYITPSHLSN